MLTSWPCPVQPSSHALPELCSSLQIVNIKKVNALLPQRPPYRIPRPDRPVRLVPVPRHDPLLMCRVDLAPQLLELRCIQLRLSQITKLCSKVCAGNDGLVGGEILVLGLTKLGKGCVKEDVTGKVVADIRELRVSCADDCHSSFREGFAIVC